MARIDYHAIGQAIQTVLQADAALAGVKVIVEEDVLTSPEEAPWVGIYIADRESAGAPIAAGTQQRFTVRYEIWCFDYRLDIPSAAQARDDLLGKVEVALLKTPTLNGNVTMMAITGGAFDSARTEGGHLMGGSVVVEIQKKATTA